MIKRFLTGGAITALALAAALPLAAQAVPANRLKADIPFEFTVAGKTLPAGEYEFNMNNARDVVMIHGLDHPVIAFSYIDVADGIAAPHPAADTKLVFDRYGNHYFLHQVDNGYAFEQYSLVKSPAEREMAKTASLHQEKVLAELARR